MRITVFNQNRDESIVAQICRTPFMENLFLHPCTNERNPPVSTNSLGDLLLRFGFSFIHLTDHRLHITDFLFIGIGDRTDHIIRNQERHQDQQ